MDAAVCTLTGTLSMIKNTILGCSGCRSHKCTMSDALKADYTQENDPFYSLYDYFLHLNVLYVRILESKVLHPLFISVVCVYHNILFVLVLQSIQEVLDFNGLEQGHTKNDVEYCIVKYDRVRMADINPEVSYDEYFLDRYIVCKICT